MNLKFKTTTYIMVAIVLFIMLFIIFLIPIARLLKIFTFG